MRDETILKVKQLRVELSEKVKEIDQLTKSLGELKQGGAAESVLAKRALQTTRHWLGEVLGELKENDPYPQGNDPNTTVIDVKADVKS